MDEQRKRELKEAYCNSRPPMGVLAFRCEPTGEQLPPASPQHLGRHQQCDVQAELRLSSQPTSPGAVGALRRRGLCGRGAGDARLSRRIR